MTQKVVPLGLDCIASENGVHLLEVRVWPTCATCYCSFYCDGVSLWSSVSY